MRQAKLLHTFKVSHSTERYVDTYILSVAQAHDHAIKCLCMNEDETMFCTGSADGDIKVWDLNFHRIVHTYQGEHARHGLFKNISQGVAQVNESQVLMIQGL